MKTIWKIAIEITECQIITMPEESDILKISVQKDMAFMWFLCDPLKDVEKRIFGVFGTGHNIENLSKENYIGSFMLFNDKYVGHVFELLN